MDALVDFLLKPRRFPDSLLAQRDRALGFFRRAPGFVRRALVSVKSRFSRRGLERGVIFAVLVLVAWGGCSYLPKSNYLWKVLEKIGIHKSYYGETSYRDAYRDGRCTGCGLN